MVGGPADENAAEGAATGYGALPRCELWRHERSLAGKLSEFGIPGPG